MLIKTTYRNVCAHKTRDWNDDLLGPVSLTASGVSLFHLYLLTLPPSVNCFKALPDVSSSHHFTRTWISKKKRAVQKHSPSSGILLLHLHPCLGFSFDSWLRWISMQTVHFTDSFNFFIKKNLGREVIRFIYLMKVLGIEPRPSCMLSRCSAPELYPSPGWWLLNSC